MLDQRSQYGAATGASSRISDGLADLVDVESRPADLVKMPVGQSGAQSADLDDVRVLGAESDYPLAARANTRRRTRSRHRFPIRTT